MTFLCVLLHLVFPFHCPLSVFLFSVFSLPVSLLCLCSFAMLMLGKWEVATHTDTCTASVLIISKRTASSLGPSGTLQFNPRKKEMNALRALIKLVQVQINKECNVFTNDREGDWKGETDLFRNNWRCGFYTLISLIYIKGLSMKFGILYKLLCLYLNYFFNQRRIKLIKNYVKSKKIIIISNKYC